MYCVLPSIFIFDFVTVTLLRSLAEIEYVTPAAKVV